VAEHVEGPLHSEQAGHGGRYVVFLHAHPMDHRCWLYQTASFSTRYRTVAVDLPGYGRSPRATPGVTMSDVAAACREAVDEVTDDPVVVAGLSIGGWLATYMAHLDPERVAALILAGTGYFPDKDFARRRIAAYGEHGIAHRREHAASVMSPKFAASPMGRWLIDLFCDDEESADPPTIIELFRALGEPDPEWLWAGIRVPTLVVTGELDRSHQRAIDLHRRIPGAELAVIEGAGHACNLERPWHFDGAVLDFLARHGLR
jgi:pimeloyl-ACP methyl ester carboxylesterase